MIETVVALVVVAVLLVPTHRSPRWVAGLARRPSIRADGGRTPRDRIPAEIAERGALGPTAWLRRTWGRTRHAEPATDDATLLAVVEGLGAALDAGLTPADAIGQVIPPAVAGPTRLAQGLQELRERASAGEALAGAWTRLAQAGDEAARGSRWPPGSRGWQGLHLLARAWALSEETGAPLATATRTAGRLLREAEDRRRRTAAAVAGARATMRLLTFLSVGGPLLAAAMGLDLRAVYLEAPVAWACVGTGLLLVVVGHLWVERLLQAALRGPLLR